MDWPGTNLPRIQANQRRGRGNAKGRQFIDLGTQPGDFTSEVRHFIPQEGVLSDRGNPVSAQRLLINHTRTRQFPDKAVPKKSAEPGGDGVMSSHRTTATPCPPDAGTAMLAQNTSFTQGAKPALSRFGRMASAGNLDRKDVS